MMVGLNKKFIHISLLLLICMGSGSVFAQMQQQKTKVKILHADEFRPELSKNRNKLVGNVKLQHESMIMTCDSLYQYADSNYIEAFGNVHAVQRDTVNLWGDYLTYDGNSKLAKVRQNVTLQDNRVTLTTNHLDYNLFVDIGYYFNNGQLKDNINTLTSNHGYYFTRDNEMFFKDSVRVHTPDYYMESDTLKYRTDTKVISITGPTNIIGTNRKLYSEKGWYNSLSAHSELYKNNELSYNDYVGRADTIVVDSITGMAFLHQNINLYDTVNNIIIQGDYGELQKDNNYAYITRKALMTMVGDPDSLFIHGDTLFMMNDTAGNHVMKAYYNTKFYNQDLQGLCDSMTFHAVDTTVNLYGTPVVWAGGNQMTGSTIDMIMKNGEISQFHINNNAMIVNMIDTVMYNQIKGRDMTGYLKNNELYLVDVNGNGETLYYPDDKGDIIGLNYAVSSYIKIYVKERKVSDIVFISKVDGKLTPLFMVEPEEMFLKNFQWLIDKQPKKKADIFTK